MQRVDGRIRVWRRRGERHSQNCIVERDRGRGGSVCVWGAIGIGVKTDMVHFNGYVNAQVYMDNALNDQVVPLFQARQNLIFMHDNARPHTAKVTTQHLNNLGIPLLPWPAKSPDLNPIEHLWDELERRLRARPALPTNLQELRAALEEEWLAIPQERISRLIYSMRSRCEAVIVPRGGHTRY